MRANQFINEAEIYQPPELKVGDEILKGKFKNSPAKIKGFAKDKHNQPVLKTNKGDVQLFKPRVTKLMKEEVNPDCFNPAFNDTQLIDGLTYRATYDEDHLGKKYFQIKVFDDNFEKVGLVKFAPHKDKNGNSWLESLITAIHPQYQGKGIARNIYAYARMLGNTIKPSGDQSDQGRAMWKSWQDSGDARHLMREETVAEGATDILYHYTTTANAARALRDGSFKLSNTAGNRSEQQYAPKGYPYFLSTTRSKVGDYHRYVGNGGVMFVLDGQWLGSRYPVKPIDYWERSWQHSPDRSSESEDRVFSKENEIPLGCVTAVHILLREQDEHRSPLTREILINAKKRGIKTYLYTDEKAWRLQDTRKAIAPSADLLKGQQSSGRFTRPIRGVAARRGAEMYGRSSLLDWIELIMKQPGQELSKSADKLRYNIAYYGDTSGTLANDLFNAKKPDGPEYAVGVKLGNYMTKNNLSVKDLADKLKEKWKNA